MVVNFTFLCFIFEQLILARSNYLSTRFTCMVHPFLLKSRSIGQFQTIKSFLKNSIFLVTIFGKVSWQAASKAKKYVLFVLKLVLPSPNWYKNVIKFSFICMAYIQFSFTCMTPLFLLVSKSNIKFQIQNPSLKHNIYM